MKPGSSAIRLAMISPIAWRTPPRHYGPWERVTSLLTESLVRMGLDVTLFATGDSMTSARLEAVCPRGYEEDPSVNPKVWECLHIANVFEQANRFDIIHNNFDFLPLTYSAFSKTPLLTTIHGFSSPAIIPVYRKYNGNAHYVSISDADRSPRLQYTATVHHGIDIDRFTFRDHYGDYLVFFGRIHHDKGAKEAIEISQHCGMKLVMAGIIQDAEYYRRYVEPHLDGIHVTYVGSVGPEKRNQLLGQARALLHPINFAEPFGLSVVEAMACGTPVIAFNKGSMPEIISSGVDGFLVENVEQAVAAVKRLGDIDRTRCRQAVEKRFTVERMAQKYARVYEGILGMSSG